MASTGDLISAVAGIGAVAILGFVGWKVYESYSDAEKKRKEEEDAAKVKPPGAGDDGTYTADTGPQDFNIIPKDGGGVIISPFPTVTQAPCPSGCYKSLTDAMHAAGGGTGTWRWERCGTSDCVKAYLV